MSCPSCFSGGLTTSHPTGTESTIHGLPTYIASPPAGATPKALIILITDAFGWKFANNRVLADHYAQRGSYLVYVPDFMNGKAMHPDAIALMDNLTTPSPTWLSAIIHKPQWAVSLLRLAIPWKSACAPEKTHPGIVSFVQAIRSSPAPFSTQDLKIGIAGFCWGGKHAFMLAQSSAKDQPATAIQKEGQKLVDCIFTAHPSYITLPTEVSSLAIPTSVIVGDADTVLKHAQALEMKKILDAKNGAEGEGKYEMVILEGGKHGFAIRTHPEDEKEMEMAMQAEEQALVWFGKWLGER
ncbi:Alpha/Beta hydrolase protein [Rhexocercosporidium sp. MPI-PUGE-AT-0058]|nr:Alpha/Beta hydrolase protein [Rhexocercosporidium sp. MPI-PUGE-AT-0058]